MTNDLTVTTARFWDAMKGSRPGRLVIELWSELERARGTAQLSGLAHLLTAAAILTYFNEDKPVTLELLQTNLESQKNITDAPSRTEENRRHWQNFIGASRRMNPFYILPAMFMLTVLTALNSCADTALKTPLNQVFWNYCFERMAKRCGDPRWIRDLALDVRPLFLTWFCLVPPLMICLMAYNYIRMLVTTITRADKRKRDSVYGYQCLTLRQNIDKSLGGPKEFYNSAWFNIIIALPYVLGIPAAISLWIYSHFGLDPLLGFPSQDPKFQTVFVNIGLYLYGLGACLSVLFFRSYFTFCWNFTSTEYDIEIYDDMIKRLPIKGWFFDFFLMGCRQPGSQILWQDVESVKFSSTKLQLDNSKRDNAAVTFLRKVSSIYESVANKMDIHSDELEIKTSFGTSIHIRLWELSAQQKLQVFQSLRKYCPSVYLDENVQRGLVGSAVMREPKYTQIWFDVLSSSTESNRQGDLVPGQSLHKDRYKIASKLASGGQAVLYSGHDANGGLVVLKEFQLTPGESFDAKIESAKDFENESAILSQLSHDTIVKMLDMFYESGRVYIVLEHVEGKTLRQALNESGPMGAQEILNLAEQMCSILEYLHGQEPPVVHRDFTPDNIILQPNGKLKLIDFSVAQRKLNKKSGDCAGKHSYTPPEQFAGQACPQSDIYALGATLYFLATGQDPVPITNSTLPAAEDERMKVINEVISKSTKLDLAQRYESVAWLKTELQSFNAGQPWGIARSHKTDKESENELDQAIVLKTTEQMDS